MTIKNTLLAGTALTILIGSTLPAAAAGTAASSSVTNSFDLNYSSRDTAISTPEAASDTFVVDEKVNFTLIPQSGTAISVSPADSEAYLEFLLTNTGNQTRDFDVTVSQSDDGDPISLTYDASNSGSAGTWSFWTGPNSGVGPDTAHVVTGTSGIGSLSPDQATYLKIIAHIPETARQGQKDIFDVTVVPLDASGTNKLPKATSFDKSVTEVVFADIGFDGSETAQETFKVDAAIITATKTVNVVSENRDGSFVCASDPTPALAPSDAFIPGACLEYRIELKNGDGAGKPAENFQFTDRLPAGVSFKGTRDATGFDSIVVDSGTVTGTVNSLAAGKTASVLIRVEID
jgi:hypothetical protein